MTVLSNPTITLITGDSIEELRALPPKSVHCCVTSPPYYGLRDYGTAKWEGGNPECEHRVGRFETPCSDKQKSNNGSAGHQASSVCPHCGAIRVDNQLGLEQTPDEYVARLVAIFRELSRVLRDDATVWLNLGDSMAGGAKKGETEGKKQKTSKGATWGENDNLAMMKAHLEGYKPKNLIGIPWRVAFALQGFAVVPFRSFSVWADELKLAREAGDWEAVEIVEGKLRKMDLLTALQADGWYLRMDVIWHKPNPMPESVQDRPTKSHEYIFLLSKQARYYYDGEAIREPHSGNEKKYESGRRTAQEKRSKHLAQWTGGEDTHFSNPFNPAGRNKRSVWTVTTKPYREAHFATYPPDLIEPCIKAGVSAVGCCPKCGAGWVRVVVEESQQPHKKGWDKVKPNKRGIKGGAYGWQPDPHRDERITPIQASTATTIGWRPDCKCYGLEIISNPPKEPIKKQDETDESFIERVKVWEQERNEWDEKWAEISPIYLEQAAEPPVVLDIFNGSGTTGLVAIKNRCSYIGIELNPQYIEMSKRRLSEIQMEII